MLSYHSPFGFASEAPDKSTEEKPAEQELMFSLRAFGSQIILPQRHSFRL
jgi:hypothetical protein